MQFTFIPTLSVSLSGDLSLPNLQPGTSADSNAIIINIGTNNVTGYTLSANVGNNDYAHGGTSYHANDLVFTNGALTPSPTTTDKFTSLSTTDSYPSLDNESVADNTWGYSYVVNDNVTWSNYSGLPIYTNPGKDINTTTTATEDSIKFKVGARAAASQVAGEYTNVINFAAVTNPTPVSISDAFELAGKTKTTGGYYAMQDMDTSICNTAEIDTNAQLIDVRDNEVYTVAKLKDGGCWMLDNLRFSDTDYVMTSEDTNIAENTTYQFPYSTWVSADYSTARMNSRYKNIINIYYGNGSGKIGIYYNFCAASAGTYCYDQDSGSGNATFDICSANWEIPTIDRFSQLLDYYSSWLPADNPNSLQYNLSIVIGGFTTATAVDIQNYNTRGYLWSSTYYNSSSISHPLFSSSTIRVEDSDKRMYGLPVRCLAK